MRLLFLLFLSVFCFFPLSTEAAQTSGNKTVTVEGIGSSKQDALLQAKRSAVEEGIGVILASETEVENFTLLKDKIITQTVGSVRDFKLLKEQQQGDSYYVQIRAVVSLDSITADLMALKILLISMDKPRTMVLMQEINGQNAETTITDYLQTKGFELVDPTQAAVLMAKDDPFIRKAIAGDPIAAAKLGSENGAEYIVVGSVKKTLLKNDFVNSSGMHSGQASVTVKVVNCSSGRIVATKSTNAASVHVEPDIAQSKAVIKASTTLMDTKLFEAIVSSFQDAVNNGVTYEVSILGVKNYRSQKQASKVIEKADGVVSVNKRSFGGGKLELSVQFKGNVDTFCDRIDSQPAAGGQLMVTDVIGNRVALKLESPSEK